MSLIKGPGTLLRSLQVCKIPKRAGQGHQRSHSRGKIKKEEEERGQGSEGATTRRGRASNRSSTALRNVTDSKGEEDPTSRQDAEKTPEGRRGSALQPGIRVVQSVCGSTQESLMCHITSRRRRRWPYL